MYRTCARAYTRTHSLTHTTTTHVLPQVRAVINFDMPLNVVDYIHRLGRTGRASTSGLAVSLVRKRDGFSSSCLWTLRIHSLPISRKNPFGVKRDDDFESL